MNKITLALVISKPGHLRNGLLSLLQTIPQIEIIAESHHPSVLLKMGDEIHPELILIDASIFEDTNWLAITKFKGEWPRTRILVMAENDLQGERARVAGADFILPQGFPAADLVDLIENSLIHDSLDETNY